MIAIIDYNAGNTTSVANAIKRLGGEVLVTSNPEEIYSADKVIFPGVGEASSAMAYLKQLNLDTVIKNLEQPTLGICLGLQLMCSSSEEGNTTCLGIFNTKVVKFNGDLKIPHMGWNTISNTTSTLFNNSIAEDNFYFVHSYYAELCNETTSVCDYNLPFSASLQKANFYATQFHPEKSSTVGSKLLENFLAI